MTQNRKTGMFSVLILLLGVLPAAAQYPLTLNLTDIKGSSVVQKDAIDILSFGWGVTNPTALTTDGPEAGKASASEFVIQLMSVDVLPKILQKLLAGGHVDEATLTVWDASQKVTYSLLFNDVVFTALAFGGQVGSPPSHTLSFSFGRLEFTVPSERLKTAFDFTAYKIK